MATALSLKKQHLPASPLSEPHSVDMSATADGFLKPSMPRPIPSPVTIPPRSDDPGSGGFYHASGSSISPQPSPLLSHTPPLPMPDFVFPARSPASAPSSYSRATGRRPRSVADFQERATTAFDSVDSSASRPARSPALPDFSFNPGATLSPPTDHAFLSPPHSPMSPRTIPNRPPGSGHRRGGSEFVGGSLRSGEAFTIMSTSPTKSEGGFPSPLIASSNGPSRPNSLSAPSSQRGHAHRRSAAISSHDLSVILQPLSPNPIPRGSSAPSSPADFGGQKRFTFPEPAAATQVPAPEGGLPLAAAATVPAVPAVSAVPADAADATDATDSANAAADATDAAKEVPQPEVTPTPPPVEESRLPPTASRPTNRARVGFSDTLEFIPRPLSLVSTDTSSTITARPATGGGGHSVSGSISSIISLNTSPLAADQETISPVARSPSRGTTSDSRPSTAGAVLDRTQSITAESNDGLFGRRRNSIPLLTSLPLPAADASAPDTPSPGAAQALPSPNKVPKRWSIFSLDPFIGNGSSTSIRSQPVASTSGHSSPRKNSGEASAAASAERSVAGKGGASEQAKPPKPVGRKSSKKKKKAKSWSILTRKSKPRRKSRRAPTPPPVALAADSDDEDVMEAQPIPEVATASEPSQSKEDLSPPAVLEPPSMDSPVEARDSPTFSQPSPTFPPPDDDTSFAMIDLDAALGPFNTPLPRNPEWEAAQQAGAVAKRPLHSAAGMSRFLGPGMHYSHRRAESAPEMPPFNRAGIPRFSSSTAMADVFEEEEEEEDDEDRTDGAGTSSEPSSSSAASTPARRPADGPERPPSIDIRVTPTDDNDVSVDKTLDMSAAVSDDAMSSVTPSRRGSGLSGLSDDDRTQPSTGLKSEYSASSLHDDVVMEEDETSMFTFAISDSGGYDVAVDTSSDSTVNSPCHRSMKGRDLAPVDVDPLHASTGSLAPASPYSMGASSGFPSPRSPMSYDANRISTAPSSVTEDNFQSLLLGEPGPEVRLSIDIPSLTSSNSTMTRESGAPQPVGPGPQPRPYLPSRNAERPASFTSTAFGRRRSSLASLHRLVSTSHGERSKLSMEVQADGDADASGDQEKRHHKVSRTKRLSRMMQFWKPKEETES